MKSESEFAQSCLTPSDPMDCSPPGSSVHGIFQARVLEWGAIPGSRAFLLTLGYNSGLLYSLESQQETEGTLLWNSEMNFVTKHWF